MFFALSSMILAFNSCSKEDNDTPVSKGTITFKVDGRQVTLDMVTVNEQKFLEGTANEYTQIGILAYNKKIHYSDFIQFSIKKGDLEDNINDLVYGYDGDLGIQILDNFTFHITSNGDDKKIIGTFSGEMSEPGEMTVTNGIINIQY